MQTKINRKFLKIETKDEIFNKPLKEDVAIEKVSYYSIIMCRVQNFSMKF